MIKEKVQTIANKVMQTDNKSLSFFISLIKATIDNDLFGMAAEMGFMLVIGIFPFMLFLMAIFGWMGNKSMMDPAKTENNTVFSLFKGTKICIPMIFVRPIHITVGIIICIGITPLIYLSPDKNKIDSFAKMIK